MNYFLQGKISALQPLQIDFMGEVSKQVAQWVNDEAVTYYMFTGQKPMNQDQVATWFKKDLESGNLIFLIYDKKTKKPIGYAGLYDFNWIARKAEFRILIGEKAFWGKGYGTEVTELLTFYGFDRLNLNRIYLGYTSANKGALKAYEKSGFTHEGILKEDIYRNSAYYDTVRMAILRGDYYKKFYKVHVKRFKPSL